ncbi:HAD family hydrolase [Cytobacillus sp. IB215316]|uniref:D-glycero-alpha-D-manno-heptose-1,7-bisphosphate 7-phosphatase n=1 Tax=Cytobacillus sp. IB215316 TaxID=3097354 RepID=UPI002A0BBBA0|nr:HAD family hydrolase [Cytobacillus sp. IB215316]MDX8360490.1 HAD family hydrolase [Cytobacillus sp. IB215316]
MQKAVFLDRDGVINEVLSHRVKFVNKPSDFYLLDGVGEAIKLLNQDNFKVFVVTNQGGVGLGYMKEQQLIRVHEKMKLDLKEYGAMIDDIAYCPHKPHEGCACRKPEPEMITNLAQKYNIALKDSYMIGDRDVDIFAGKSAGTKTILVGNDEQLGLADMWFANLLLAVKWIIDEGERVT